MPSYCTGISQPANGTSSRPGRLVAVEQGGAAERLGGGNHAATLATVAAWEPPHGATLKGFESTKSVPSEARRT